MSAIACKRMRQRKADNPFGRTAMRSQPSRTTCVQNGRYARLRPLESQFRASRRRIVACRWNCSKLHLIGSAEDVTANGRERDIQLTNKHELSDDLGRRA